MTNPGETPRPATFTRVQREARLLVLGRRTVRTLEGRIQGSLFSRRIPVAVMAMALFTISELATLFISGAVGITLHATSFVALSTYAALLARAQPPLGHMLTALAPVPLIRIVGLTSPLMEFSYIQWFMIIGLILYAAIVMVMRILKPALRDVGLRLPAKHHIPLEIAVILMGFAFGYMEWHILKPGALITSLSWRHMIAPVLVLYVSTGLLEELLFRGILQRYAGIAMGVWPGIIFVTAVFAILHTGWDSWLDVAFVGCVGLTYSIVVRRTGSIIGVSISHGITNTMLFLVMPFWMAA